MTRTRLLLRTAVPVATVGLALAAAGPASADTVAYNGYDTDGNGYLDGYGFDDSGDGYEDTWAIDWNEDGWIEQVAVDTDLDGLADTWGFDSDQDGYIEEVGLDTTYNGQPDVWGVDQNVDGSVDLLAYDVDDDGYADYSEAAGSSAYAYASVTYLFAEVDGWTYWEVSYEYGYSYLQSEEASESPGQVVGSAIEPRADGEPAAVAPSEEDGRFTEDLQDLAHVLSGLA